MPYLEESTQPSQTQDSVFTEQSDQSSQQVNDSIPSINMPSSPPEPPAPRRSARSTRGAPPVRFGKVYTFNTIVSKVAETPTFRQTLSHVHLMVVEYIEYIVNLSPIQLICYYD